MDGNEEKRIPLLIKRIAKGKKVFHSESNGWIGNEKNTNFHSETKGLQRRKKGFHSKAKGWK
jgi:hypothetical protein